MALDSKGWIDRGRSLLELVMRNRFLATLLVLGLLGVITYVGLQKNAFRWTSLDLKLTREQSIQQSRDFLEDRGYDLRGARTSASFWSSDTAAIYLEKKLGTEKANELFESTPLPIWGWETRFFWPQQKEEYQVWWSPDGSLLGFQRIALREQASLSLTQKQALTKASQFLDSAFREEFADYELVEESSDQKSRRLDHYFRWKKKDSPLDSRIFLRASVLGTELAMVSKEMDVPEAFKRNEQKIESRRDLLSGIFSRVNYLLSIAFFIFLFQAWKRRALRWKPSLILCGTILLVTLLEHINNIPIRWHAYSTNESIGAFWMSTLGLSSLLLLVAAAWNLIPLSSADAMGRFFPNAKYSLGELTNKKFYSSIPFMEATLAGFGAAGIHLGFVTLFYLVGSNVFGFYAPQDVQYDNILGTSFPWVAPLVTGLQAALTEESVFRLFAVSILFVFTKKKWLAVVLPALLWGFLHTGYYVEPIYARGLELTLVGIFLGFVFLKYGIWATIVSHYIYNATISSSLLFQSENLYFRFSAICVIGLVILPLGWAAAHAAATKVHKDYGFRPLLWKWAKRVRRPSIDRRLRKIQGKLPIRIPSVVTPILLVLTIVIPGRMIAPQMNLTREEASQVARRTLDRLGFPAVGHLTSARLHRVGRDKLTETYVKNRLTKGASLFLDQHKPIETLWSIRFVAPEQPELCNVSLHSSGTLHAFSCYQSETARGARLAKEVSQRIAEGFLYTQHVDVDKLVYATAVETQHAQRTDMVHRWTDPDATVGDLTKQISVRVSGDRVSSFQTSLNLPDSYQHEASQQTSVDILRVLFWILCLLFLVGLGLRSLFDHQVISSLRARVPTYFALISMGVLLIQWCNQLPQFWSSYTFTSSVGIFMGRSLLRLLGELLTTGLGGYVIGLLFMRLPPQMYSDAPSSEDLLKIFARPPWRWRRTRAAFIWAVGFVILEIFIRRFTLYLADHPTFELLRTDEATFSTWLPSLSLLQMIWSGVLTWSLAAILLAACKKYLRNWVSGFVILISLLALIGQRSTQVDWIVMVGDAFYIVIMAWFVIRVIRFSLPFFVWLPLLHGAVGFFAWLFSGNAFFQQQAMIVLLSVGAIIYAIFRSSFAARKEEASATASS